MSSDELTTFDNLQEKNNQVLSEISQLQEQEQQLYNDLEKDNISSSEKQEIINKINKLSQMRMLLYRNLNTMVNFYAEDIKSSSDTLVQQKLAIDIIENKLNETKMKTNIMENEKNNKLKMVQINTYYEKKYNSYKHVIKTFLLMCVLIILLTILTKYSLLPSNIYAFLIGLILIFFAFKLGYQVIDISNRDPMNWDRYDTYFDPSTAPVSHTISPSNPWETTANTCIGQECCYKGSVYNKDVNKCITDNSNNNNENETNFTETFSNLNESKISNILGKYAFTSVGKDMSRLSQTNNVKPLNPFQSYDNYQTI